MDGGPSRSFHSTSPHSTKATRGSMEPDLPANSTSGKSEPSRRRSARLQEARSSSSSSSLNRPPPRAKGGRRGGGQEGAASSSSAVLPVAAVVPGPPPPRFDASIVDAASYRNLPRVIELHEEGISLDSRGGVRLPSLHHHGQ